jgi:signal transduction histidine kinase
MWRRFRPPLIVVTAALLGLIALLAVRQYRWLGQISEAERERLRAGLTTGATEFATDFDRELARAFLLFQPDGPEGVGPQQPGDERIAERFAVRHDRWQATARFPRLLESFYLATQDQSKTMKLDRFDPASRRFARVEWAPEIAPLREQLASEEVREAGPGKSLFIRRMAPAIWESAPALVVPTPMIFMADGQPNMQVTPTLSYSILTIDLAYVTRELLPSLVERHFNRAGAGLDYQVAIVSRNQPGNIVFQSTPSYAPAPDARADATADLFQIRTQDFTTLAAEVRRFATFTARVGSSPGSASHELTIAETRPLSILIEPRQAGTGVRGTFVHPADPSRGIRGTMSSARFTSSNSAGAHWKLVVAHPAGSLEAAVDAQRRRNLAVSSTILGLLVASMGLLVLSTRRAQRLARQQMEFVATVSHELRTPLAVIRSAAENLADGVVDDGQQIRRYGELMRAEGRRLTEMVEQILEFAGIQSGQRSLALRSIALGPLVRDVVASSTALIEGAGLEVELDLPENLPPVLGDEPALRRVFQNLVDNAIKYGASGGWMRLSARRNGPEVLVTVADRGIGIDPADQARIFEPFYRAADVVAAQIQGAGLGLSLVQRIVAAHGGRVTVKSTPRNGSEFTVQLPIAVDDSARSQASVGESEVGPATPRYS